MFFWRSKWRLQVYRTSLDEPRYFSTGLSAALVSNTIAMGNAPRRFVKACFVISKIGVHSIIFTYKKKKILLWYQGPCRRYDLPSGTGPFNRFLSPSFSFHNRMHRRCPDAILQNGTGAAVCVETVYNHDRIRQMHILGK